MEDKKISKDEPSRSGESYESPKIEEVITPERLEREVAYAGLSGPSTLIN
jgi:hypothetical protein